jgi:Tfp pilus assembly protein PilE
MVVVTIIGVLANIAIPAFNTFRNRADAAHIYGDIMAIRVAVFDVYISQNAWPPTTSSATVPAMLVPALPNGFEFRYKSAEYQWQLWALPNGMPATPTQTVLFGLTVRTPDLNLMAVLKSMYRGPLVVGSPNEVTFVIE